LISAKEAVIVTGIFLGFFFGWAFSFQATTGWRFMVLTPVIFAVIMGVGVSFIPQSPRFLVLQAVQSRSLLGTGDNAKMEEASRALQFFRQGSPAEVEVELETMRREITESVGTEVAKVTDAFKYRRPLVIGCGLVLLQQITGQPSVLYFQTGIFKSAGFGDNIAALSSVLVGLVKLLATLFTVWRVDLYGRRFLLFVGIAMMAVSLAFIGTAFLYRECDISGVSIADCAPKDIGLPRSWALVTVGGLMLYVSGYQVGFGPIAWLMISEVFPLKVRGAAMSTAAIVNFSANILMTLTSQVLQDAFTPAGVFFGYLALTILSLAFVFFIVPETKGKTLEEIEAMLRGKSSSNEIA
jgi:MFS family permease